jgi:hypothetical protein
MLAPVIEIVPSRAADCAAAEGVAGVDVGRARHVHVAGGVDDEVAGGAARAMPAAALPPMALMPALRFAAPAVVVTVIVPAWPPRALASVSALLPLALIAVAPGVVIVSEAPVIVTLPASLPCALAPAASAPPLVVIVLARGRHDAAGGGEDDVAAVAAGAAARC